MKRIVTLMRIDATNASRDSLVIWAMVAPILLAVGLRLFLPGVQGSGRTYAVQVPTTVSQLPDSVDDPQATIQGADSLADALAAYGAVERFETAAEVRSRVGRTDAVGGFALRDDGAWELVLEGNEGEETELVLQSVYTAAARGSFVAEYTVRQTGTGSPFREYASVGLVMLATLIGGLAVAFAMVDEKEQQVTRAFTVSPLGVLEYYLARGILAAGIGLVTGTLGHLILTGTVLNIGRFLLAIVAAVPLPLFVALAVGGIAKNQIQAVAALKVVMMLYLTLPFASIVVPRAWHWLFYAFPNYWMFRSLESIYVTGARAGDLPVSAGITFVSGVIALVVIGMALRKQVKPQ